MQAESKVNTQPAIRQVCSVPNVPRINATAFRTDSSRERRPASVKFEVKQSRSYSNTLIDEGLTDEQFNDNNVVRLLTRFYRTFYKIISNLQVQSPSRLLSGRRSNIDFLESPRSFGPIILPNATIKVRLRNGIRLDALINVTR